MTVKYKDFIQFHIDQLSENPLLSDLEVWQYSDDEGNSILPMYMSTETAFVYGDVGYETDEYFHEDSLLEDWDDSYGETFIEFQTNKKRVVLI